MNSEPRVTYTALGLVTVSMQLLARPPLRRAPFSQSDREMRTDRATALCYLAGSGRSPSAQHDKESCAHVCLRAGLLLQSWASFFWVRFCYVQAAVVPLILLGVDQIGLFSLHNYYLIALSLNVRCGSIAQLPVCPRAQRSVCGVFFLSWLCTRSHHSIINLSLEFLKTHSACGKASRVKSVRPGFSRDRLDRYIPSWNDLFFSCTGLMRGGRWL